MGVFLLIVATIASVGAITTLVALYRLNHLDAGDAKRWQAVRAAWKEADEAAKRIGW